MVLRLLQWACLNQREVRVQRFRQRALARYLAAVHRRQHDRHHVDLLPGWLWELDLTHARDRLSSLMTSSGPSGSNTPQDMSPAFASNACAVFAAGPIGAALAVFRSNCEEKKGQRRVWLVCRSPPRKTGAASESVDRGERSRLAQRPRGRGVLLQLRGAASGRTRER